MVYSLIILGVLGFLASVGLGIASRIFAVKTDPLVDEINEALPQANCGGCGYAGCSGFANALVKGEAKPSGCVAGGPDTAKKVSQILGVAVEVSIKRVAHIKCSGSKELAINKFEYSGFKDCVGAQLIGGGYKGCAYGCLRLGTCESVCPFGAIKVMEDSLPVVDPLKCTGCGSCVSSCPRKIIELVPIDKDVKVDCNSLDKGSVVTKICKAGCISCGKCEKTCPVNAIKVINNLAQIDYSKCINCGLCVTVCPQKVIHKTPYDKKDKKAKISEESCVGCGKCKKVCPVNAITGELKGKHTVNAEKCIGCGLCVANCPKDAITL